MSTTTPTNDLEDPFVVQTRRFPHARRFLE
jgi:hypothetical protein